MKNYIDIFNRYFKNKEYGDLLSLKYCSDNIDINYEISNICNQYCSYCMASSYSKKKETRDRVAKYIKLKDKSNKLFTDILLKDIKFHNKYIDYDIHLDLFIDFINKLNFNNNKVTIVLTGFEPTLVKNLYEIIETIYNNIRFTNKFELLIFTNGKQSTEYYKKLIKTFPNIRIDTTFHPEFADINHFEEIQNMFIENKYSNYYFRIALLNDKFYYDKIKSAINIIKEPKQHLKLNILKQEDNTIEESLFIDEIEKNDYREMYAVLKFEDGSELKLYEPEINIIAEYGVFYNMCCNINKKSIIFNDKIIYTQNNCSDLKIKINNYMNFVNWYNNNDYIICNKFKCDNICNAKANKWKLN